MAVHGLGVQALSPGWPVLLRWRRRCLTPTAAGVGVPAELCPRAVPAATGRAAGPAAGAGTVVSFLAQDPGSAPALLEIPPPRVTRSVPDPCPRSAGSEQLLLLKGESNPSSAFPHGCWFSSHQQCWGLFFFYQSPAIALPRAGASGGGEPKVGGEGGRAAGEAEAWPGGSASLLGGCLLPGVGRWMGTACGGPEYEMQGAAGLGQDELKGVFFVSPLRTWEKFWGISPLAGSRANGGEAW